MFVESFEETLYCKGEPAATAQISNLETTIDRYCSPGQMVNCVGNGHQWVAEVLVGTTFMYRVSYTMLTVEGRRVWRVRVRTYLDKNLVVRWDFSKQIGARGLIDLINLRLLKH